jgi:hypothetical protein
MDKNMGHMNLREQQLYRAFACDVKAAMLVFQYKRILIRSFCQVHQHGRHRLCSLIPLFPYSPGIGLSANALHGTKDYIFT